MTLGTVDNVENGTHVVNGWESVMVCGECGGSGSIWSIRATRKSSWPKVFSTWHFCDAFSHLLNSKGLARDPGLRIQGSFIYLMFSAWDASE